MQLLRKSTVDRLKVYKYLQIDLFETFRILFLFENTIVDQTKIELHRLSLCEKIHIIVLQFVQSPKHVRHSFTTDLNRILT